MLSLPKTGIYEISYLGLNGKDVSTSISSIHFMNLTETMPNWQMAVCFLKEPEEVDLFQIFNDGLPFLIAFSETKGGAISLEQKAIISRWEPLSITLLPSK